MKSTEATVFDRKSEGAEGPVGVGGVGELHAVFSYGKPHTWMCLEAA
jgi:hypothetical protein